MKILVMGTSGMLGNTTALYLTEHGHEVTGLANRANPFKNSQIVNFLDFPTLGTLVTKIRYDAVVNCTATLIQESEKNKPKAVLMNAYLPHFLAVQLQDTETMLIHRSTDCVFSGNAGNYSETAVPDATEFYGKTKALGEVCDAKNLTLRTSVVGPDFDKNGTGLLNWFLKQKGPISGYTHAMWTGVSSIVFAQAVEKAIEQHIRGLVNLVNGGSISKLELLRLFNKDFRNNKIVINASDKVKLDKSLLNTRKDFRFQVPSYEEMVMNMAAWCKDHQDIYPEYYNFKGVER